MFDPYALNFVQYRAVPNLTLVVTGVDMDTPYVTLPMVFVNSHSLTFTIPRATLAEGVYYEFRLGFPFPAYTFYSNTRVTKTFDANSPFVSHVQTSSTNSSVSVAWQAPEYLDGLVGYIVSVSVRETGNGGSSGSGWGKSDGTLVTMQTVPLSQLEFSYGCATWNAINCLVSYTTYLVDIAVLRERGVDEAKSVFVATQRTVVPVVRTNTAAFYYNSKIVNMTFVDAIPFYNATTTAAASFLNPLSIATASGDVNVTLTATTLISISATAISITINGPEYTKISAGVLASAMLTPFVMKYGANGTVVPVTYACKMISITSIHCRLMMLCRPIGGGQL